MLGARLRGDSPPRCLANALLPRPSSISSLASTPRKPIRPLFAWSSRQGGQRAIVRPGQHHGVRQQPARRRSGNAVPRFAPAGIELMAAPSLTLSILVPAVGPAERRLRLPVPQTRSGPRWMAASATSSAMPSPRPAWMPLRKVWDNGFAKITSSSSRQLSGVDDLKGFKIRVPVTALLTSLFSRARRVALEHHLQRALFGAADPHRRRAGNPLAQVATGKLYEVQKYCALSNHCWSGYWILGNRRAMAGLPPDLARGSSTAPSTCGGGEGAGGSGRDGPLAAGRS